MKFQLWNCILVASLVIRHFCQGSIICSQCHLADDSQCADQPPAAEPCFDPGDGIVQTCSIIRIFKNNTSELLDFRRSCATTRESGCYYDLNGNRVCADICFNDGCNAPNVGCTKHRLRSAHAVVLCLAGLLVVCAR